MSKEKILAWAFSILSEKINSGFFGSLIISMQNGKIHSMKIETVEKPPVD